VDYWSQLGAYRAADAAKTRAYDRSCAYSSRVVLIWDSHRTRVKLLAPKKVIRLLDPNCWKSKRNFASCLPE
jgi:hypothetical protein